MNKLRRSNLMVGAFVVVGIAGMFSVPYYLTKKTQPLLTKDGPLTGSQRQRGMYLNSGTDVGIDPNWDHAERKYKAYKKPADSKSADSNNDIP